MNMFKYYKWYVRIVEVFMQLNLTMNYINDDLAYANHIERNPCFNVSVMEKMKEECDGKLENHDMVEVLHNEVQGMGSLFNSQFIVYICTIIDEIINESVYLCFINEKNKMHKIKQYQDINISLGISFDDIMSYDSYEEQVKSYAKRSTRVITSGNMENQLKRVEDLFGTKIQSNISNFIIKLSVDRNKIVHDNKELGIDFEEILEFEKNILGFLEYFKKSLKKIGIEIETQEEYQEKSMENLSVRIKRT